MENNNNQGNGLAIASLVCGISSIILACCCNLLGIGAGIAGVITGIKSANEVGERSTMAKAGLITSIVGLVLSIILFILGVVYSTSNYSLYSMYQ